MSDDITVSVTGGSQVTVDVAGSTVLTDVAVSGATASVSVTQMGGDRGPQGDVGPANTLAIGTVTTGAAGSNASATITGTAPNQTLSLTIPRGDVGQTGSTGATGAVGPAGPANSLSIGTVTTVAAGSSASATITGTAPNQTLSLALPRGDTGAQGSTGSQGAAGAAATVTVGTVTTGAAGSSASVTNGGSSSAAVLNFTLPRGDTGAAGSNGTNGREVQLQTSATHVQWRYAGDTAWTNLVSLSSITGPQGPAGSSGGMSWVSAPSGPSSAGTAGAMAYDSGNLYVCVAANTWKLLPFQTWPGGDPYFSSVSLLLHMDGANGGTLFPDASANQLPYSSSGVTTQTALKKFGSASAASATAGGFITYTTSASSGPFVFGTGDWTVEFFLYQDGSQSGRQGIFTSAADSATYSEWRFVGNAWRIDCGDAANTVVMRVATGSGSFPLLSASVPANQWCHVAFCRSGASVQAYIDGVAQGAAASVAGSQVFTTDGKCALFRGGPGSGGNDAFFVGSIDEFRVTKGVARYTANFTPPAAPFPDA